MTSSMRSLVAVGSATFITVIAVVFAPVVLMFVVGQLSTTYVNAHADLVLSLTYAVGTSVIAALAGAAIGLLAPARPLLHALAAAAVIVGLSVGVRGVKGLPHGWGVAGLLCQVTLMVAVATLTWQRRVGRASLETQSV